MGDEVVSGDSILAIESEEVSSSVGSAGLVGGVGGGLRTPLLCEDLETIAAVMGR